MSEPTDRAIGCFLGLACGDAVGTTVEFRPRGSFEPLTDMVGGGPFGLEPGQWTDDTSMALCLAESLLETGCFDPVDQLRRYVRWFREGHLSATGECFDIGNTVRMALHRFEETGRPDSGPTDPRMAGNGSIMRLAPVALFAHPDPEAVDRLCAESSRTTHGAEEAIAACRMLGAVLHHLLRGASRDEALHSIEPRDWMSPALQSVARGEWRAKGEAAIRGSGYVVESLEAAFWCFHRARSFEEAVLLAANLGDDADTTAAVVGQLAGAHFGQRGIPERWRLCIYGTDRFVDWSKRLIQLAAA
ncbi:MAG: ADP-ribosylglycohydrolase family protein [Pseudomonadales bacterium]|jgi:ADP-ribosyl-[dinitrogen reductase] hydrolase|nr:ADP-ribosylglycohydrolase family protein [Pseudomonadales bacterium]